MRVRKAVVFVAVICSWGLLVPTAAIEKIKPEELLARHRASIATDEVLAGYKTAGMQGTAVFRMFRGGTGSLEGRVALISDGLKSRFSLDLGHLIYPGEQFICDGDKVEIQYVRKETQSRSDLGTFLYRYPQIIKNGLWGGSLTRAWALLNHDVKELRLRYRGLSEKEGKQVHEAGIDCKGCDEVEIHLFFETETFRHVLTTYKVVVPAAPTSNRSLNTPMQDAVYDRFNLEEHFSNFQTKAGVTQPTRWLIRFDRDQRGRPVMLELESRFDIQLINSPFEAGLFEAKP